MELKAGVGDGERYRTSSAVARSAVRKADAIHEWLGRIRVVIPTATRCTNQRCREAYEEIRNKRNALTPVLGLLHRATGELEVELSRVKRLETAERSLLRDRGEVFLGTTNDKQRDSRLNGWLRELLDAEAVIEQDLARVKAALSHGRLVAIELQAAFEETSRIQASIEGDWNRMRGVT